MQDGWLAVYAGIDAFEGRSSLTSRLFGIVLSRARCSTLGIPARCAPGGGAEAVGHDQPQRLVGGRQLWADGQAAIGQPPAGQCAVMVLREMEGCSAGDACMVLGITGEPQRVLLPRAHGCIRAIVERGWARHPSLRGGQPH
jgi:RNA polymerase sigma-70 factor, ECF subfamily